MIENFGSPGHAERMAAPEMKARQIASLLDHNTRRRAADAARGDALEQHRQAIEGGITVPIIQIPNRLVRIRPTVTCPFCSGTAFDLHVPPVLLERAHASYRGSLDCLLCGRTVAHLEIGTRMTAEQFRALPSQQGQRERGRPTTKGRSCCDCSAPTARYDAERCKPCANRHRRQQP